jgi:hypothetical protein
MMYSNFPYGMGAGPLTGMPLIGSSLVVVLLWSFFWKGLALWHSSRRNQPWWFVVLLFVNSLGILEIIYLFAVAKLKFDQLFSK